jgi:hypothetical protein
MTPRKPTTQRELHHLYDVLNEHYFGGELPAVMVGVSLFDGIFGDRDDINGMCLQGHMILLHGWLWTAKTRSIVREMVASTLLHEMVHVAVETERPTEPGDGHGERFAAECNRIGLAQGWDEALVFDPDDYEPEDEAYCAVNWPPYDPENEYPPDDGGVWWSAVWKEALARKALPEFLRLHPDLDVERIMTEQEATT